MSKYSNIICYILMIAAIIISVIPYFKETDNATDPYFLGIRSPYTGWYTYEDNEKIELKEETINLDRKAHEPVSIYGRLPEITALNNTLFFRSVNQEVRVYVEGEEIYSFGEEIPVPFVNTPGNKWNIIRLGPDMSGEEIRIETIAPYEFSSGNYNKLYLIPINEANDIILEASYYNIFFAVLLFVIGFAMLGLSAVNAANDNYSIINISGQLYLIISVWIFAESQAMGNIIKEPVTIYFINMFSLVISPILFFKYLKEVDKKREKLLQKFINIYTVNAVLCFIIEVFTSRDIIQFIYIFVGSIMFTITVYVTLSLHSLIKNKFDTESTIRWLPLIFIVIGGIIDIVKVTVFNTKEHVGVVFVTSICIYIFFNINMLIQEEYKKQRKAIQLKGELIENRRRLLLSQIKPHFLYNSLNSISALCKFDPALADKAIIRFSRYLRNNMNSIDATTYIDFMTEIEHVKNYVFLEQLRFPNIEIVYQLDYVDFEIPPLTLQPLVENAIKHGISKKIEGGTVIISTKKEDEFVCVELEDNGIGFDVKKDRKSDSIGLKNITKRLEDKCNAIITMESKIDQGTKIEIIIPLEEEVEDENIIR